MTKIKYYFLQTKICYQVIATVTLTTKHLQLGYNNLQQIIWKTTKFAIYLQMSKSGSTKKKINLQEQQRKKVIRQKIIYINC